MAAAGCLALAAHAKDSTFGAEMVAANHPNSTLEDVSHALDITRSIGSHSSWVWHWSDSTALPTTIALVPYIKAHGLKVMLQMGTIFLYKPGPPPGYPESFGAVTTRLKYLTDVATLARTQPDYLVLMTENNLLYRFNRPEWENFRTLYREAYQTVKRISPQTKVGVSYLYTIWFVNYFFDNIDVPSMMQPADFVAFTTYPADLIYEGHYNSIAEIPPEWYGLSRYAYPDRPIVFSEVGWASNNRSTPELQAEFIRNLPRLFSTANPELVTWAVLHDMSFFQRSLLDQAAVDFLTGLGVDIDALFDRFNGTGLLYGDGTPKPALDEAVRMTLPPPKFPAF